VQAIPSADALEQLAIADIVKLKSEFRNLRDKVLEYLTPSGLEVIRRIRNIDKISKEDLPILVYTDKMFNFLPPAEFNELYELDPGFIYKDRDDPELRSSIPASTEYFRIMSVLDRSRRHKQKQQVFISHGHKEDWRQAQQFLKDDLGVSVVEFNQSAYRGRTIIQHLESLSDRCSYALIVMTGEDLVQANEIRSRENVVHEIGFFQGRFGTERVAILHEDGVHVPSNLQGVIYIPYQQGHIDRAFPALARELNEAGIAVS
jgi:hypothetical protein